VYLARPVRATNTRRLLQAIWADPRGRRWLLLSQLALVDVGSHDDLMAAGGFYHDLYMSQFRGDATPAVTA
jgi:hypothetical protein